MTAGKETNTVELQLRDFPGEQEHIPGSAKHKEEKKEVFSKVMGPGWATCRSSVYTRCEQKHGGAMEGGGLGSAPWTATAQEGRLGGRLTTASGFQLI